YIGDRVGQRRNVNANDVLQWTRCEPGRPRGPLTALPTNSTLGVRVCMLALRAVFQTMNLPPLILASASPRRAELLRQLGVDFKPVPSDASEIHHDQLTGREIAQINAYRK